MDVSDYWAVWLVLDVSKRDTCMGKIGWGMLITSVQYAFVHPSNLSNGRSSFRDTLHPGAAIQPSHISSIYIEITYN